MSAISPLAAGHMQAGLAGRYWRLLAGAAAVQDFIRHHYRLSLFVALLGLSVAVTTKAVSTADRAPQLSRVQAQLALQIMERSSTAPAEAQGRPVAAGMLHGAPGYALVLAIAGSADRQLRTYIACAARADTACDKRSVRTLIGLQIIAAILGIVLLGYAAWALSGSRDVAVLTALLAALGSPLGEPAGYLHHFVFPPLLLYLYMFAVIRGARCNSRAWDTAAGAALAATSLFIPIMAIVVPLSAVLLVLVRASGCSFSFALARAAAVLTGAALVAVAAAQAVPGFLDAEIFFKWVGFDLSRRLAFGEIAMHHAVVGFLIKIPFLDALTEALAPDTWLKGYHAFVGDVASRSAAVRRAAQIASATSAGQAAYFVTQIWSNAFGFLLATPALVMSGLVAKAGIIGLAGIFFWGRMFAYHRATEGAALLVHAFFPIGALLFAITMLSTAHSYMQVPLIAIHAYAIAVTSGRI